MGISGVGSNSYNYYGFQHPKNNTSKSCGTANTSSVASLNYTIHGDSKMLQKVSDEVLNIGNTSSKIEDKGYFFKIVEQYAQKVIARIENGESAPAYQIGGQSFTEEEWNKLVEKIDKSIDKIKEEREEQEEWEITLCK